MSVGEGTQAGVFGVTGSQPQGRVRYVPPARQPRGRVLSVREAQPPQGQPVTSPLQQPQAPGQPVPQAQPGPSPQPPQYARPTPQGQPVYTSPLQQPQAPGPQPAPHSQAPSPAPAPEVRGYSSQRSETVVEARGLRRVYGSGDAQVVALDGVSLTVQRGQFVAIMGASGSGKSTLLHCLAGLDTPTQGQVLIAGRDLTTMKDQELTTLRRDHLGFVFQSFNLLPTLSAEENILLPLRLAHRKPDTEWYSAVVSVLGIENRLDHRPSELSGGQQQRVAVARALIGRPAVVFADEPTGALDTAASAALLEVLARTCQTLGQTVVMVTHDPDAAATTSRIIRLTDGHITHDQAVEGPSGAHAASPPAAGSQAPSTASPGASSRRSQHTAQYTARSL